MPLDKQPDWEATRNGAAVLVSRMPSVSVFKPHALPRQRRRREGVKGACREPFAATVSAVIEVVAVVEVVVVVAVVVLSGSATEPINERTDKG